MKDVLAVAQSLAFGKPIALWLIAIALPFVILVPLLRLRAASVLARVAVIGIRLGVAALLVLALAEPTLRPAGHARAMVFALDVSDSVGADQQQWARAWVDSAIAGLPPGSHADTIEFGERAQLSGAESAPSSTSTDLGAALRMAGTLLPRDASMAPEVVLLTDGWQDAGTAASESLPSGVAVSYVPLPQSSNRPIAVVHSVTAPPIARAGDRIDVGVDLQSTQEIDAQLRVHVGDRVTADAPVHLQAGDTRMSLPQQIDGQGFVEVRVELQIPNADATSSLSSVIVSRPAGKVLMLEDEPGSADELVRLLQHEGLEVDRMPPNRLPPSARDLTAYDGAVLVNTPATSLTLDQQRTLQSFVQDLGRGLMVVGGPRTFSPGGYEGTVLDDMLPVSAVPPIEPQQGSLALFLVIDRSGSMDVLTGGGSASGGASKLAMARQAAMEASNLLQPQDTLGVIAFDSTFQWVVPPTKLAGPADVKRAQSAISSIKPGGGTSILPPLEAAFQAATTADAPLKHIVLLTDGESNDHGYEELLARMQPFRVTLSTLAIGSDADTKLLSNLARIGGGRYYFTERSTQIPRIASKETAILTRNAVVEGTVAAVVGEPSPLLRDLAGDVPPLLGYVATTRKDRAVTALETERGHPLLAHWQYGLGRVVVWTSDAQRGWASAWSRWNDAASFWGQAVRWSLPAPVRSDFLPSVAVGPDGRGVTLSVQALRDDGGFADLQDTRATVVSPNDSAREVGLPQRAPGQYALDTRVNAPGVYRVLFRQGAKEEVAAFTAPDGVEAHTVGQNLAVLDALAQASGGQAESDPLVAARPADGQGPAIPLWPWLAALALLLLPLDVLIRRRT
jgi:Ca-activated chloride channel family protein